MSRQIEDARLNGARLDDALAIGREHLHREGAGGSPVGITAEPLRCGSYQVRVSWIERVSINRHTRRRNKQLSLSSSNNGGAIAVSTASKMN